VGEKRSGDAFPKGNAFGRMMLASQSPNQWRILNVLFVELFGTRTPHHRDGADPPAIAMDVLLEGCHSATADLLVPKG
jgi:hypothetical protein